jgi:hypothetical protein
MNVSQNFHMQLHKYTAKVSKPPTISLQTLEVTHDIQLYQACMWFLNHVTYKASARAHTHTHIYVTISGPYIFEHKHIQKAYLRIYITMETQSSYIWPKNMTKYINLKNLNLEQHKTDISYIWIFIYRLALYIHTCITCMYMCLWLFWLLDNGPSRAKTR